MAGKKSVNFIKPSEPSFLKKFKKEIGFKEGPSVDTKKALLEGVDEFDDRPEEEDEKPVIVIPENSKISKEEVDDYIKEKEKGGKIIFKKPTKRKSDEHELNASTKAKKKKDKTDKDKSKIKKVKNNSLLSFDDEEDEDS